jgi:PST family polysaccharide transporter
MTEKSIGTRAAHALVWTYGSTIGGRLLSLVAVAILARILDPRDFGLVALALIFTGLLDIVRDFGLSQALVVTHEEINAAANTVFRWGVLIGLCGWGVAILLAPLAARFFDEPEVTPLLTVLGASFFLKSLGLTHYALAQRALNFRARTISELSNTAGRGLAGIALAVAGFGAWSLVLAYLLGLVCFAVVLWWQVPWRPSLRGATVPVRGMFAFGGILTLVDILAAVIYSTDGVVIGKMIGADELGLYSLGLRLPELIILNLSISLSVVLFPAFAGVARERLGYAFLQAFRFSLMLSLPLAVGLIVLADPVVMALFGPKWEGSVGPMQVLVLYALFYALGIPAGTVYKALGNAMLLLKLAVPQVALIVVSAVYAAQYGIVAVAACTAGVTILFFLIGLLIVPHMIPVSYRELARVSRAPLAASAITGVLLFAMQYALDAPWIEVIVGLVAGGLVYLGLMWKFDEDLLRYILGKFVPRFRQAPAG